MPANGFKGTGGNGALRMIVSLALVGIISGIALAFVYKYSMPKIKVNVGAETDKAIRNIFPGAKTVVKTRVNGVYETKDANGKLLGYAFIAEGNGYQGEIKLIAGVNTGITSMKGMEVLESQETPGLGAEIASADFRKQFAWLSITHDIEYVKNQKPQKPYQIEAITGATISSRAVVNILNKRIDEIRKLLKG